MQLLAHPWSRPIAAVLIIVLVLLSLATSWRAMSHRSNHHGIGGDAERDAERLVVAHFMLGNTYPFTPQDWETTFALAEDTSLDALALNLGPEEWQLSQAHSAFSLLRNRPPAKRRLQLFLSLDMNVLPSSSSDDGDKLRASVLPLLRSSAYLRWRGRLILSTFGGHAAEFGGGGWVRWLDQLNRELGERVIFWPAFFLPPQTILDMPFVDGVFAWNNAWPMRNETSDLREDEVFLAHPKPYMAAVSPCFSTHYGTIGPWAWGKNWIYRSDDLLLPTRFSQLLDLPPHAGPEIIQIISWNDYGESHYIAPILGAQPGSEAWTNGMDHEAFREMTRYFAEAWRSRRAPPIEELKVWMWYRPHPASMTARSDMVGRPDHADWDLINIVVLTPPRLLHGRLTVYNHAAHHRDLKAGRMEMWTVPFGPGQVRFQVLEGEKTIMEGQGRRIDAEGELYNFNFWSGSWSASSKRNA